MPHFADLRTITHGAESIAQGFDPMIANPGDPMAKPMNYPRIWQSLYALGLNAGHTTVFGVALALCLLTGVCLLLANASRAALVLVFAAVLSPAILLGVERGNIDQLMFLLLALSVFVVRRSHLLAGAAVFAAFLLKLFPIFGWTVLLGAGRRAFLRLTPLAVAAAVGYVLLTWPDLALIRAGTPHGTELSYGLNVLWMRVAESDPATGEMLRLASYAALGAILLFAAGGLLRPRSVSHTDEGAPALDAFRVGAAVYLGTFILGNNWDYRLMFLILAIPQLARWAITDKRRLAWTARGMLVALFLCLWHLVLRNTPVSLALGPMPAFLFDEALNWLLFAGLARLLAWSAPEWLRELATGLRRRAG